MKIALYCTYSTGRQQQKQTIEQQFTACRPQLKRIRIGICQKNISTAMTATAVPR